MLFNFFAENFSKTTPYIFTSYLLNWVCGGFERSVLGKYSPNPVSNKVSEYHADGNRYRYMGPASTHGLTMAVTVSRTPVSGLPSLFRGHSYQLGLKQFPVALSRSYGGDRSSCASYRFRLGSESHFIHSKLWSVIHLANKKATYCCSWSKSLCEEGRSMSKWPSISLTSTTTSA